MSERTLGSPRQHRDIRQGVQCLQPADQAELAAAHLCRRLRHPRPCPGCRLPLVVTPVEDHSANDRWEFPLLSPKTVVLLCPYNLHDLDICR